MLCVSVASAAIVLIMVTLSRAVLLAVIWLNRTVCVCVVSSSRSSASSKPFSARWAAGRIVQYSTVPVCLYIPLMWLL